MGGAAGDEVARQAYCTKSAGDLASLGSDSCSQCGLEFMLLFLSVSLNFCVISLFIFLNLLPKFPYIRNTIPLVLRIYSHTELALPVSPFIVSVRTLGSCLG